LIKSENNLAQRYTMHYICNMKKYKYLTLAAFAEKVGVSRNTALRWAKEKRIKAFNPAVGVWIVTVNEQRPKKKRPWQDSINDRLELQT
jgi:DNA-binding XRE family transcriptional regulator